MSTMLQEVLRWRRPARPCPAAGRWAAWSRSLSERHGRIAGSHRRLALTLVQPLGLMLLHSQRWEHVAWTLSPRINLALGPVLHQTGWHRITLRPPDQTLIGASPVRRVLVQRLVDRRLAGQNQPDMRLLAPAHEIGVVSTTRRRLALGPPRETQPSPVQRVFARLKPRETVVQASQSQIARASRALVRRAVHERQRLETRVPVRVVAREQKRLSLEFASTSAQRAQVEPQLGRATVAHPQAASGVRIGATPVGQAMAPPSPIAIQQLTEQVVREIDRRLVAQRERMGKS